VKLHLLGVLEAREVVRMRNRRQHEGRRRLSLLLNWRSIGRTGRKRALLRGRCRVYGMKL
jgi:hypothetical protein